MAFDPDAFLTETTQDTTGFDPDAFMQSEEFQAIGSEDQPINKSPLSTKQRLVIGFGENPEDNINYLKSKFEDAKIGKNGKEMVKKDGLWHQVDEKGFSVGDLAEMVGEAPVWLGGVLGEVGGGIAGGAAGGVGAIPGVIAGGAAGSAAGEAVKQKIAQKLGVRDEFEFNEVLKEGAIGGAGAALGAGLAKFGSKGGKQIVKQANKKAGGYIGDQAAELMGGLNGTGGLNTKTLFKHTDDVLNFKNAKPERLSEIADDVVKSIDDFTAGIGKTKQSLYKTAKGAIDPNNVFDGVVKDIDGAEKPLFDVLKNFDVIDEDGAIKAASSSTFKGSEAKNVIKQLQQNKELNFRQIDNVIKRIDKAVDFDPVLGIKKANGAEEAVLKKIRFVLKNQRNEAFGVTDQFDDMARKINILKDPSNPKKNIFKNKDSVKRLLKTVYNDAKVDDLAHLEDLALDIPELGKALENVKIHNASVAYRSFVPPTHGGFGSGSGAANILRSGAILGSGGMSAPLFSPRAAAELIKGSKMLGKGTQAIAKGAGKPGVAQTGIRSGMRALGL